jgi:hypothetical protein
MPAKSLRALRNAARLALVPEPAPIGRHRATRGVDSFSSDVDPQWQVRTRGGDGRAIIKTSNYALATRLVERLDRRSPSSGPHVVLMGAHRA